MKIRPIGGDSSRLAPLFCIERVFDYDLVVGEFRWSQLASSGDGLFEPARRVVGRGEYRGLTFHEVEARSIISKAPPGTPWFGYSINAYRGCSHACSYCVAGDTRILMADGRSKPISEVRPGDSVCGTERRGSYRRFVASQVLDQWSTVKAAYRVIAGDGTELITSGDHRFLTDRGWKHVTGSQQGISQRPHLTVNNRLIGLGGMVESPKEDEEYRRGYLCGMIRGDGTLGTYTYERPGRNLSTVHRFRLALVDLEGLRRSQQYLEMEGVPTDEFLYARSDSTHRATRAIRTSESGVAAIRRIIEWPPEPTDSWGRGFLAGIYDAKGSHSRGILRISNTDRGILYRITSELKRLGFDSVEEPPRGRSHVASVRIRGGMSEQVRFFLSVSPAISRKRTILGTALKNGANLGIVSIEPLGISIPMYDLTTTTGDFIANGVVSHNCFARPTHDFLGFNMGSDFETQIVVKVNAVDLLRAELAPSRWVADHIAMGTNTDPYQPAEGKYKLTRGIVEVLLAHKNPFSILTKSPLVLRDVDLIVEASKAMDVRVDFSIATLDEGVWRRTEPGVPHPRRRMEAVAKLRAAGIPSGVMMAPIIPGISDHPSQIADLKHAAKEAGAEWVHEVSLHLRGVRSHFLEWLKNDSPELVPMYLEMYPERRKAKSQKPAPRSTAGQLSLGL